MQREKLSDELMFNIIIDWEKRSIDKAKIARKFGICDTSARRVIREYKKFLKNKEKGGKSESDSGVESRFESVVMPDEDLQDLSEKIEFYKSEAEKYKALAREIEKSEGVLLKDRKRLFFQQVEKCLENHSLGEIDGRWKMDHDEFMEFFSNFSYC